MIINDHMIRSHDDMIIDHNDHMITLAQDRSEKSGNDTNDHTMRSYDNMITSIEQHHDHDCAKSTNNDNYANGCQYTVVGTTVTLTTTHDFNVFLKIPFTKHGLVQD